MLQNIFASKKIPQKKKKKQSPDVRFNLLHSFRRELAACQETAYNRLDNILGNARCQYPNLFTLIRCPPLLDPPPLPLLLLLLLPAVPHVLQWTARSLRDSLLKLQPVKPHRCSGRDVGPAVSAGQYIYKWTKLYSLAITPKYNTWTTHFSCCRSSYQPAPSAPPRCSHWPASRCSPWRPSSRGAQSARSRGASRSPWTIDIRQQIDNKSSRLPWTIDNRQ